MWAGAPQIAPSRCCAGGAPLDHAATDRIFKIAAQGKDPRRWGFLVPSGLLGYYFKIMHILSCSCFRRLKSFINSIFIKNIHSTSNNLNLSGSNPHKIFMV